MTHFQSKIWQDPTKGLLHGVWSPSWSSWILMSLLKPHLLAVLQCDELVNHTQAQVVWTLNIHKCPWCVPINAVGCAEICCGCIWLHCREYLKFQTVNWIVGFNTVKTLWLAALLFLMSLCWYRLTCPTHGLVHHVPLTLVSFFFLYVLYLMTLESAHKAFCSLCLQPPDLWS